VRAAESAGSEAVGLLTRFLFEQRVHRITTDLAAADGQGIPVYAKVGFRPVGVIRPHERAAAAAPMTGC
jgi:aminoglycoside 6'-N-acetyltransferase